jgi:hypothetical protein
MRESWVFFGWFFGIERRVFERFIEGKSRFFSTQRFAEGKRRGSQRERFR